MRLLDPGLHYRNEGWRNGNDLEFPSHYSLFQGGFMAKIIEFYIPTRFRKKATKWIAPKQHAKVIPFDSRQRKSA
jgi:hypothetical protein